MTTSTLTPTTPTSTTSTLTTSTPATPTLAVSTFSYFPSLVFRFDLPDAQIVNEQLLSLTSDLRELDQKGIQKSNRRSLGGWHSRGTLHKLPDFEPLVRRVHEAGERISTDLEYDETQALRISSMWSIVNPPGAFNLAHVHPGCLWSGVYYVKAPDDCGKISFTDPRTANVMNKPAYTKNRRVPKKCWTKVSFSPVAGSMLIFPSWLYHAVEPNLANPAEGCEHDGERVIISFNMSQKKK